MSVQALGYLRIGSDKLDDWSSFATGWLGMQATDGANASRAFRMDDRRQRLIVDRELPDTERCFGWELADAAALDALAERLEQAGVAVRREPAALADQRFVRELISFADPAGNRLEAFHGAHVADEPFRPGRGIAGFRTGTLGMGHVVLMVPQMETALPFYRDLLGLRISDYIRGHPTAYFLRANARHHSVALFETPKQGLHHLMMELFVLDDVGAGYDIALGEADRVAVTLGRHPNDLVTSFYMRTPSNFLVEYGWGGREIDDATWQPSEMTSVSSFWGHKGLIRSVAGDAAPPEQVTPPGSGGRHAPLQVAEGTYQQVSGVCPWWDALAERSRASAA
jgi:2,3-dihydroxybiphenyl 1,2-dioxygenase